MTAAGPARAGASPGETVVAGLLAERRRIAMAFRAAGATRPDRATSLEAMGLRYDAQIDYLVRLGAIRDVDAGYWFDEAKYQGTIENPWFRRVGLAALAAVFLLLVVTIVGVFTAG